MKTIVSFCILFFAIEAHAKVVWIDGPRIQLSDLLKGEQSDFDLGVAPLPGHSRILYRRQIVEALSGSVDRKLPDFWEVRTRKQVLSCSRLKEEVSEDLSLRIAPGLELVSVGCKRDMELPSGQVSISAQLLDKKRWAGQLSAVVEIQVGAWDPMRIVVPVVIDGQIQVLIANEDLATEQNFDASNFSKVQRKASHVPIDAIISPKELVGYAVGIRVPAGTLLRKAHLKPIPLVHRGSAVTILVTLDGLRVTGRGVVREDGRLGDTVNVLALSSQRLLKARVIGPRAVTVDL
ncbi:MAG: flagellar basal body P-ring formation chaperone FlgA [Pseudomonadota bacterium]